MACKKSPFLLVRLNSSSTYPLRLRLVCEFICKRSLRLNATFHTESRPHGSIAVHRGVFNYAFDSKLHPDSSYDYVLTIIPQSKGVKRFLPRILSNRSQSTLNSTQLGRGNMLLIPALSSSTQPPLDRSQARFLILASHL
jgi:hypothetical protein